MSEPKKWKRGDIGPDGRVFRGYNERSKNGESWFTAEKFEECKACDRARQKAYRQTPEYKAYLKNYHQTTEYKARQQSRERKAYQQTPEYKARHKACQKAYEKSTRNQSAADQFFILAGAAEQLSNLKPEKQ